mmetsp:Transcript_47264/g.52840  ORF Transcript_47264/g.52840 Transcript_47264/m.52840 type:complete len:96 (-) Transcript_47264:2-289(-)
MNSSLYSGALSPYGSIVVYPCRRGVAWRGGTMVASEHAIAIDSVITAGFFGSGGTIVEQLGGRCQVCWTRRNEGAFHHHSYQKKTRSHLDVLYCT